MHWKKLLVYVGIPVGVSVALNAMYFSGNVVLQRIVAPNLPPLPLQDWRELGLLENLQNLLLLGIIVMAALGVYRKRWAVERLGFGLIFCGAMFMLLEETDYGTTFHEFFTTPRPYGWFTPHREWDHEIIHQIRVEESFSLHNRLDLTDAMKRVNDLFLILFFGILPLVAWRFRRPWLSYVAPERWAIAALVAIYLLREMTHLLGAWEKMVLFEAAGSEVQGELNDKLPEGSSVYAYYLHMVSVQTAETGKAVTRELGMISKNLSEFRELNAYYLYFVHVATVVFLRRPPAGPPRGAAAGDGVAGDAAMPPQAPC